MLSKSQIKIIKRLQKKKYRQQEGLFVVEGPKAIKEFLKSNFILQQLYTTEPCFSSEAIYEVEISSIDLKQISFLTTPNKALAVFKIPKPQVVNNSQFMVALDGVRDPGNLGTIIRLCDWFGVKDLVCSLDTVDCFNPKVIQATMGSLTRVNISYLNLEIFLKTINSSVFGALMEGENIYKLKLPKEGVLVMGNEANGISSRIKSLINQKITIPRFGELQATESLNVATATAILLSEFKRN